MIPVKIVLNCSRYSIIGDRLSVCQTSVYEESLTIPGGMDTVDDTASSGSVGRGPVLKTAG